MARARWIVPWADSETKPAIYHCVARVVDRRFAFWPDDKEQFRIKITRDSKWGQSTQIHILHAAAHLDSQIPA
jgi:hypothetical protein